MQIASGDGIFANCITVVRSQQQVLRPDLNIYIIPNFTCMQFSRYISCAVREKLASAVRARSYPVLLKHVVRLILSAIKTHNRLMRFDRR